LKEGRFSVTAVGYQYVIEQLGLRLIPLIRPAALRSVTRMEELSGLLAVPKEMEPSPSTLGHLLFALKHEGTNLQVLAAAAPSIAPADLLTEIRRTPTGRYIRIVCFAWEKLTGKTLEDLPVGIMQAKAAPLFDPELYLTNTEVSRDPRWRVLCNGLGDWDFCPIVRRTKELDALLSENPLEQVRAFLAQVPPATLERVLAWAYLHETRSSYEIEHENPSGNKAEAFTKLLRQAHARHELTEEFYVELQNTVVTSPHAVEASFRLNQNHLSDGTPGPRGVTYVPPPVAMLPSLIGGISRLANSDSCAGIEPLLRAALASFGFVFTHPFNDGNGRLSRFLAHYALCQSGALPNGMILPLSTAMKRNERQYLQALQSFSAPARQLWNVIWLDDPNFEFELEGHESIYRYFDATDTVEFIARMALETLRTDLHSEVDFLACYDKVVRATNDRFDVPGSTLADLIVMAFQNGGTFSQNRRKQYRDRVDPAAMDFIEQELQSALRKVGTSVTKAR
jgi:Fic family protein